MKARTARIAAARFKTADYTARIVPPPAFDTVPPPPNRLLVFARLPESGLVKTRLAASIGDERALAVYEAMLRDVLVSVGASDGETEVEVMWAPTASASRATLARAFAPHATAMQTGETLGDRLTMAFSERFFFHRTQKIVAVGVDEPRLGRDVIDHAFALLDSCEWVLGPADDGGYYLIGCRAQAFSVDVFRGVAWGTDAVLAATLARIREAGSTLALLPQRYDIDTLDDLRRYAGEAPGGELGAVVGAWNLG
jgi:rSAM/selenodomain-associated transferase 1